MDATGRLAVLPAGGTRPPGQNSTNRTVKCNQTFSRSGTVALESATVRARAARLLAAARCRRRRTCVWRPWWRPDGGRGTFH